jgi:hypothetical protein
MSISLAPEIWDKIVKHACVDGGRTGCALSLVSRYIRDVSHSSRLQSIALDELQAMQSAALELEHRAPEARIVRFIYLGPTNATTTKRTVARERSDEETQLWHALCVKIVTLVSQTVEVLTISVVYGWSESDWLHSLRPHPKAHFPRLRSLAGCITSFFDIDGAAPSMPVLEHLDLIPDPCREGSFDTDDHFYLILFRQTPCLTHLRLSDLHHDDALVPSLGYFIGLPDHITHMHKHIAQNRRYRLKRPSAFENISLEAEMIKTDTLAPSPRLKVLRMVIVNHLISYMDTVDPTIDDVKRFAAACQPYRAVDIMSFIIGYIESSQRRLAWENVVCGGLGMWDIRNDLEHRGSRHLFYQSGSFESQEAITSNDLPRLLSHSSVNGDP